MDQPTSRDYFERRAIEELRAAEQATDLRAAQSHRDLADRYRELACNGQAPEQGALQSEDWLLSRDFRILP